MKIVGNIKYESKGQIPKSSLIEFENSEMYVNNTRMSPTSWIKKDIEKIQLG